MTPFERIICLFAHSPIIARLLLDWQAFDPPDYLQHYRPDYAAVCKHIAATHHILGERFDEDPFLIFRLRGRTEVRIFDGLRKRQGLDAAGMEHDSAIETAPALAATPASFWGTVQPLTQIASHIKSPNAPMPVLQRLGQPGFSTVPLSQLLGAAYQHVTQTAVSTAFENSEPDET